MIHQSFPEDRGRFSNSSCRAAAAGESGDRRWRCRRRASGVFGKDLARKARARRLRSVRSDFISLKSTNLKNRARFVVLYAFNQSNFSTSRMSGLADGDALNKPSSKEESPATHNERDALESASSSRACAAACSAAANAALNLSAIALECFSASFSSNNCPRKGGSVGSDWEVAISNNTHPSPHASTAPKTSSLPSKHSGGWYTSVPPTEEDDDASSKEWERPLLGVCTALFTASPKSPNLHRASEDLTKIFSSLTSL